MILKQFPDLLWLKQQINQRFQQRRGYGNIPLDQEGFPSVVIHTKATEVYRPDICGPISLFLNLKGESNCTVEGRSVAVPSEFFFISNRLQEYTLEIRNPHPVETFNIHIGEAFSEGVLSALLTPADTVLDNGLQQKIHTVAFHNQLYRKDAVFNSLVDNLKTLEGPDSFNKWMFEDRMEALLLYLLQQHRQVVQQISKLPPLKQSTKVEVYRRLSCALDYLHSHAAEEVDVDVLATASCISKYHFLRLFKQAYRVSPYQYLQRLRLEKAKQLLLQTDLPVQTIAHDLGFQNSNSFSRLFLQRMNAYPSQYRSTVK